MTEITLSGEEPIKITYNGEVEDILSPIHTSSMDINIVNEKILKDLYTATRDNILVDVDKKVYEYTPEQIIHHPEEVIHHEGVRVKISDFFFEGIDTTYLFYDRDSENYYYKNKVWDKNEGIWKTTEKSVDYSGQRLWYIDGHCFILYDKYSGEFGMFNSESKDWDIFQINLEQTALRYCYYLFERAGNKYLIYSDNDRNKNYILDRVDYENKIIYFKDDSYYYPLSRTIHPNILGSYQYQMDGMSFFYQSDVDYSYIFHDYNLGLFFANSFYFCPIVVDGETSHVYTYSENYYSFYDENGELLYESEGDDYRGVEITRVFTTKNNKNYFIGLLWKKGGTGPYISLKEYILLKETEKDKDYLQVIRRGTKFYKYSYPKGAYIFPDGEVYLRYIGDDKYYHFNEEIEDFEEAGYQTITPAWDETIPAYDEKIPATKTLKSTTKLWEGYLTPNIFSQTVTTNLDEINITAMDVLSMLKYYKVNDIFRKGQILCVDEIINLILSKLTISAKYIYIQQNNILYNDEIPFTNLQVQVNNYWDENGEDTTLYDMLSSVLRIFNLTIFYKNNQYYIIDPSNLYVGDNGTMICYNKYQLNPNSPMGDYHLIPIPVEDENEEYLYYINRPNHTLDNYLPIDAGTVSIDTSYSKVSAVSSLMKPEYKNELEVKYTDTEKYKIYKNTIKTTPISNYIPIYKEGLQYPYTYLPRYNFIFNGTYINDNFGLFTYDTNVGSNNLASISPYHLEDYGTTCNFYGKTQNNSEYPDVGVEINKTITAFVPDNGIPPEFLLEEDFNKWYIGQGGYRMRNPLKEDIKTNTKFGSNIQNDYTDNVIYHQEINDVLLTNKLSQTIDIDFSHKFSRTGFGDTIGTIPSSNATEGQNYIYFNPISWQEDKVIFNRSYFNTIYEKGTNRKEKIIWNKVKIQCLDWNDGQYYYFNGFDWTTERTYVWFGTLVNDKPIFQHEFRPQFIRTEEPTDWTINSKTYALSENNVLLKYTDGDWAIYDEMGNVERTINLYSSKLSKYIGDCSEGKLSIFTPNFIKGQVDFYIDIYFSTALGKSGCAAASNGDGDSDFHKLGEEKEDFIIWKTIGGGIAKDACDVIHIPYSGVYFKAEHCNIDIQVKYKNTNYDNVFDDSDVKYSVSNYVNYFEEKELDDFNLATYNSLVENSYSYLLYDCEYCEPTKFSIHDGYLHYSSDSEEDERVWARLENYVLFKNLILFGKPRVRYEKNIKTNKDMMLFDLITGNEIEKSIITGYSWNLKDNLYSINAVDYTDVVGQELVEGVCKEIPHIFRNKEWRLSNYSKS